MSPRKDPPGYPGDDAVKEAFAERVRQVRIECGLSLEQAEALLRQEMLTDPHEWLPQALGLVVKDLRKNLKMSRWALSRASGLSFGFILAVERGKAKYAALTDIVRIAMALKHPVPDFVDKVAEMEQKLKRDRKS